MQRLVVSVIAACALWAVPVGQAADATVSVTATGFNPATVSIETGEQVTWTNNDRVAHRVVVTGTQCNLSLQPNQSSSCTFPNAGSFSYSDPNATGTTYRGTVNVTRAPARNVTIDATRNAVIFGGALNLRGRISSGAAGETVTIASDPINGPVRRTEVTTGTDGVWSLRVQPRIETEYTATWRNNESRVFTALVRPRIQLRKVGRNLFSVVVVGARAFNGDLVVIKRQKSRRVKRLVNARSVTLVRNPRTRTISQRRFRLSVPRGYRLRAFMPAGEAAPGYLSGWSNFIRV